MHKPQWNFNQNTKLLIHENASKISSAKWRPFCPGGWVRADLCVPPGQAASLQSIDLLTQAHWFQLNSKLISLYLNGVIDFGESCEARGRKMGCCNRHKTTLRTARLIHKSNPIKFNWYIFPNVHAYFRRGGGFLGWRVIFKMLFENKGQSS